MNEAAVDPRLLRSFVVVGEELHFGRAAARLQVAQPALSQQVQRLEGQLGCRLLERTSRSVSLTPAGQVLLERTRRTLAALAEDVAEARSTASGGAGSLRVGFVSSAVLTSLPGSLRRYRNAHPRVAVSLRELRTTTVTAAVADASLDIGIVRDPDTHPELMTQVLSAEPYIALLHQEHPSAASADVSLAQLAGDPFVLPPRSAGTRAYDKVTALCEQHGFHPQVDQVASHWLTIASLVGAGLGVSIAPACVRRIAGPTVVCLPLRDSGATSELCLLTPRHGAGPQVLDFTREALAGAAGTPSIA